MYTKIGASLCGVLLLAGCACKPTDPEELKIYEANNDPLEPMNRAIFSFNMKADKYVINPVARGYRQITTKPMREGVSNFISNLEQPLYFLNSVLEADGEAAWNITKRFTLNTMLGFFGVFDVASELEIPKVRRSFGDTFATWGIGGGPYLVVPFLGASNVRDATGMAATWAGDPISWIYNENWLRFTKWTLAGLSLYENNMEFLENLYQSSTDPYAAMRTMWQQNRKKDEIFLRGEENTQTKQDYEFDFPDEEEE